MPFEYLINKLGKAIGADSSKMAEWIADHTAEGGALSCTWQDYKTAFVQYFPALPNSVNRDTWAALSMDSCGGFHKYVQAFLRQAAEVGPSEAEKIHTFKRGLSGALQNAVLLDTTTKEPWTEFAPLLKVATSFANELLGRKTNTSGNAESAGRGRNHGNPKSKKRSTSQANGPSRPSGASEEAKAKKSRTKWCRAERRCDKCLQPGHFRADCPDSASEADREKALTAFYAWQKQDSKGKAKKNFHK